MGSSGNWPNETNTGASQPIFFFNFLLVASQPILTSMQILPVPKMGTDTETGTR